MFGHRIDRGLILAAAAFVIAIGQFTCPLLAQTASVLQSCAPENGRLVCKGDLNLQGLTAFGASIDEAIKAAEGLDPVKLASWSSALCDDPAPSRNTDWVKEVIAEHSKQKPGTDNADPMPLTFKDMRLMGEFMLPNGLDLEISFENVSMCGDVTLGGTFTRPVSFQRVVVTSYSAPGLFSARGAKFEKSVVLEGLVAGSIDLDKVVAADKIDLTSARFGHLKLSRAKLPDLLMSSAAQLNDMHEQFSATQTTRGAKGQRPPGAVIELTSAKISSLVYGDWSRIEGGISAQRLETEILRFQIAQIAHADFRNIRADEVRFGGSTLGREDASPLPPCGLASSLIRDPRILSFEDARVTGNFLLETRVIPSMGTHLTQVNKQLCLNRIILGGQLQLAGLRALHLDLSGIQAAHGLELASKDLGPLSWIDASRAVLDLSNSKLGRLSISDELDGPAELSFKGMDVEEIDDLSAEGPYARPYDSFKLMIDKIQDPAKRVPPYLNLERMFSAQDDIESTEAMAFERMRNQTDALCWFCSIGSFFKKMLATTSEMMGGYGLKPERTFISAVVIVVVGAIFAGLNPNGRALVVVRLQRPVGRGRLVFELLLLSIDRLIPLVSLDKLYSEWVFSDVFLRSYFVLHALMGLLLAGSVVTFVGRSFGLSG